MKRMWAWIIWGLLGVIVLALVFNGNAILSSLVGSELEKALGVEVDIVRTEWDIFNNRLLLHEVSIANPQGYFGELARISLAVVHYQWGDILGRKKQYGLVELEIRKVAWIRDGENSNLKQFNKSLEDLEKQEKTKTVIDELRLSVDKLTYIKNNKPARDIPLEIRGIQLRNIQGNENISVAILESVIEHSGLIKNSAGKGEKANGFVRFGNKVTHSINKGVHNVGRFFRKIFKKK